MAILIDGGMPENCRDCRLSEMYPNGSMFCIVERKKNYDGGRPDWCPLREVVRCKDCKYWVPDQVGVVEQPYCTRIGCGDKLIGLDLRIGSADHYCCFGERRG